MRQSNKPADVADLEKAAKALKLCGGDQSLAAKRLGIPRTTLRNRLDIYQRIQNASSK